MAKINLKSVPAGDADKLAEYLTYLREELTFCLQNLDRENMTEQMIGFIEGRNADGDL